MNLFKTLKLPARASAALLVLRLLAGLAFIFHGWPKIQNPTGWMGDKATVPGFLLALAAISEFGGGIAWMLGLLTPLASFGMACTMAYAVYLHAVVMGDPFVGPKSYELASVYFCVSILFILAGPGSFSADRAIFGEKD